MSGLLKGDMDIIMGSIVEDQCAGEIVPAASKGNIAFNYNAYIYIYTYTYVYVCIYSHFVSSVLQPQNKRALRFQQPSSTQRLGMSQTFPPCRWAPWGFRRFNMFQRFQRWPRCAPGFYESLEPYPGAVEALNRLLEEGADPRIGWCGAWYGLYVCLCIFMHIYIYIYTYMYI